MANKESRKKKVLEIIIRSHIDTVSPVGSRLVAKRLGLSSATIRNIMADLEEEGLITQPHTSAGRIPTDKAYRHYADGILHKKKLREQELEEIRNLYLSKAREISDLAQYTSRVLSALTRYTGFVVSPENRFYLDGAYHMLEQPEFKDIGRMRIMLEILEEKEKMLELLNAYFSEGRVSVHIGRENCFKGLQSCAVITASYKASPQSKGGLGIIGPTRMQYERVIPLIEFFSEAVSDIFGGLDG